GARGGPERSGGGRPGRMRRAIVVAEAGDALRVELDPARRRRQPLALRVVAEFRQHHVFIGAPRQLNKSLVPEPVEVRDRSLVGAQLLAPAAVKATQPLHLAAALRIGLLAPQTSPQRAGDREVARRL